MSSQFCWRAAMGAVVLLCSASSVLGAPLLTDSTGDTFGIGSVQLDITTYGAVTDPSLGNTTFTANFASAISPPSAFAANSIVGFIDIDLDRNAATGGTLPFGGPVAGGNNWINFFIGMGQVPGPTIALGDERFVDIGSEAFHPGLVDVVNALTNNVDFSTPITFSSSGFSLTVPLIGSTGNGGLNFGLLMGTFVEPTDRAPNGASPATSVVPEPSSLLLFGICGLALFGSGWWVRP